MGAKSLAIIGLRLTALYFTFEGLQKIAPGISCTRYCELRGPHVRHTLAVYLLSTLGTGPWPLLMLCPKL
jgi:hypothetical protein